MTSRVHASQTVRGERARKISVTGNADTSPWPRYPGDLDDPDSRPAPLRHPFNPSPTPVRWMTPIVVPLPPRHPFNPIATPVHWMTSTFGPLPSGTLPLSSLPCPGTLDDLDDPDSRSTPLRHPFNTIPTPVRWMTPTVGPLPSGTPLTPSLPRYAG